jgi:peptidoglycan hydrolase-like protein with peptidoglycan-binding domain
VPGAASGASGVAGANAGPVAAAKMNASNESNTASVSSTASGTPSISPPPSVSSIARDLSYGSEGWDVLALQTFLNEHGYSVATTSIFDAATLQAVAQFQSDYHLPLSGYVGPFTLSLIVSVENGTYVPGSSTTGDQLIPISHTPVLLQGN